MGADSVVPKLGKEDSSWKKFERMWTPHVLLYDWKEKGVDDVAKAADRLAKMRAMLVLQTADNVIAQEFLSLQSDAEALDGEATFVALKAIFTPQLDAHKNTKLDSLDESIAHIFVHEKPKEILASLLQAEENFNETITLDIKPTCSSLISKFIRGIGEHNNAEMLAWKVHWQASVSNGAITEFRQLINQARSVLQTMEAQEDSKTKKGFAVNFIHVRRTEKKPSRRQGSAKELKCWNCDKIGHFARDCEETSDESDSDSKSRVTKRGDFKTRKAKFEEHKKKQRKEKKRKTFAVQTGAIVN